jgi:hypothetical protein
MEKRLNIETLTRPIFILFKCGRREIKLTTEAHRVKLSTTKVNVELLRFVITT